MTGGIGPVSSGAMATRALITVLLLVRPLAGLGAAAEPAVPAESAVPAEPVCVDRTVAAAIVEPTLDSGFFRAKDASYPAHIIEHEDGHLENTLGGEVSKEDTTRIEHTAKCVSTHQGEHPMSFCDARPFDGGLLLEVAGGLPAYASALTLWIGKDRTLKCRFNAVYPRSVPGEKLSWTITKKSFKMIRADCKPGERLLGWLSVEFVETLTLNGKVTSTKHRIEGFVKPVIAPPVSGTEPTRGPGAPARPLPTAGFR